MRHVCEPSGCSVKLARVAAPVPPSARPAARRRRSRDRRSCAVKKRRGAATTRPLDRAKSRGGMQERISSGSTAGDPVPFADLSGRGGEGRGNSEAGFRVSGVCLAREGGARPGVRESVGRVAPRRPGCRGGQGRKAAEFTVPGAPARRERDHSAVGPPQSRAERGAPFALSWYGPRHAILGARRISRTLAHESGRPTGSLCGGGVPSRACGLPPERAAIGCACGASPRGGGRRYLTSRSFRGRVRARGADDAACRRRRGARGWHCC